MLCYLCHVVLCSREGMQVGGNFLPLSNERLSDEGGFFCSYPPPAARPGLPDPFPGKSSLPG